MKIVVYLLGMGLLLSGCSTGAIVPEGQITSESATNESAPSSAENLDVAVPQISIEGAVTECYDDSAIVTLFVRNEGASSFYYNSMDADSSTVVIETVLRNENGLGFADEAWHLTPEEGIAAGASGELYAYFTGLFIGFDGRFNQVEVKIDGDKVFEQKISLSQSACS